MSYDRVEIGPHVLYCGDCLEILPTLAEGSVDAVVTDPPYKTGGVSVPIRGRGVAEMYVETETIGNPWGYTLDWIREVRRLAPSQWIVFAHFAMLGGLCSLLEPAALFVWRKSNAPRMARPVPRHDCEFIVWSRVGGCGRMREFESMVIDVPMPQAGCMASERILEEGSGRAVHPCQKPLAVVAPFIDRLPCRVVLDPYAGLGTTGVACERLGRRFVGIEIDKRYFDIACKRIEQEVAQGKLDFEGAASA